MIAVAVAAGLLAASRSPIGLIVAFGLAYVALIGILWWMFHGFRRLSALCFGVAAALSNIASVGLGIYRFNMGGVILVILVWLLASPLVLSAGAAWVTAATRREARPRRSPSLAWPLVFALYVQPLTILLTRWPLHLAFLASMPALDRLADRVATDQKVTGPEWAGLFRVVGSAVEPSNGNVGLIIDPDPSGCSGFVRVGAPAGTPAARGGGPFYNLSLEVVLGDRWRYQCED